MGQGGGAADVGDAGAGSAPPDRGDAGRSLAPRPPLPSCPRLASLRMPYSSESETVLATSRTPRGSEALEDVAHDAQAACKAASKLETTPEVALVLAEVTPHVHERREFQAALE